MRKIFCLLMIAVMLSSSYSVWAEKTISAEYYDENITADFQTGEEVVQTGASLQIAAKSAILMEKETGEILYEMNSHEKRAPASITKIMSLLIFMEAIDNGDMKLDDVVVASPHACSMGGSQIWLKENEQMTVDELLRAVVIASANDATVALAEEIAGSEDAFVGLMNDKAKALGMKNTHFENSSGLDAEGHLTTAFDIALMSCALLKHPLIKKYSTVWMDSLRNGESELVNTNKLIRFYEGATGLKTGTTSEAGFCVSATAEKNGMELCAVIMGAENNDGRFSSAKALLNYGFANWEMKEVEVDKKSLKPIKVEKGVYEKVGIAATGKTVFLLKKGEGEKVRIELNLPEKVTAPIVAQETLGKAQIFCGDKKIGEIDIVSVAKVDKMSYSVSLSRLINALFMI